MKSNELKHAKERDTKDWALIGFDLDLLAVRILEKYRDDEDIMELHDSLLDAAELCFNVAQLKRTAENVYREIESI